MRPQGPRVSDNWLTPAYVFDAIGEYFDIDVAGPRGGSHVPCRDVIHEDSLAQKWDGFVWMNPPFGRQSQKMLWLEKFFSHGNGIALMPDRTSAPWFQRYAPRSEVILFVSPKIKFERPDGTRGEHPGEGTALFTSGSRAASALMRAAPVLGMAVKPQPTT